MTIAATSEDLWASLAGRITVPRVKKAFKLHPVTDQFVAGGATTTLRLKVPVNAVRVIERAPRDANVRAKFRVRARDAAGNASTNRLTITLKH